MPKASSTPQPAAAPDPAPAQYYQKGSFSRENSMGYLMRRIGTMLVSEVDARLTDLGLTHAQWAPLVLISRGKAATQAELARELQLDAGALTRTLDRLEAKGLCRRERSTAARRVVHLALTPEGEAAVGPVPGVLCDVSNVLLSGFQPEEFEVLLGLLRRMHANAEAMRAATEALGEADAREAATAKRTPGRTP
jgi:DNA-binding MarR family transcriptional regulator